MIKGKDVIGLKVITINGGREIDDVQDLIYDPSSQRVLGLIVDRAGWFNDSKIIPIENVKNIGEDAVMVESRESVLKGSDAGEEISELLASSRALTRTKLITEDGKELGDVEDIYFDEQTGKVIELIVSEGMVKDVQSGKKRVKTSDIITIGKDATIVSAATEYDLDVQDQTRGIKGRINEAKAEGSGIIDEAKHMYKMAVGSVKQKTNEFTADHSEDLNGFQDKAEQQAIKARMMAEDKGEDIKSEVKDFKDEVKKFTGEAKQAARDPEQFTKRAFAEKKQTKRSEKSRGERAPG